MARATIQPGSASWAPARAAIFTINSKSLATSARMSRTSAVSARPTTHLKGVACPSRTPPSASWPILSSAVVGRADAVRLIRVRVACRAASSQDDAHEHATGTRRWDHATARARSARTTDRGEKMSCTPIIRSPKPASLLAVTGSYTPALRKRRSCGSRRRPDE